MKYDHVFLDSDNTLLDFDKAQEGAFAELLARHGVGYTDELYARYSELNHGYWKRFEMGAITKSKLCAERFEVFFGELGITVDGIDDDTFYQQALSRQYQHMPYAEPVCQALKNRAKLTVVTNGVGTTAHSRLSGSGLDKYMSHIVVSELVGHNKPSREFFDAAFKIAGCKPGDKIIIVGDSLSSDIRGGINADIDTCWYNPKAVPAPDDMNITYTVRDLRQLLDIIE